MFLTETNQIKIGDFGLARTVIDITRTNCGTKQYMSPEIWSAGCVLYELITLKRYFNNSTRNDSFYNLKTNDFFKTLLKK